MDITDRKLIQLTLEELLIKQRESEDRLIEAQKLAHVGSFETDLETGHVKWSEEVFNIYERDINLGEPSYDEANEYVHPDDKDRIWEEVEKGTENIKPFEIDYRIIVNNKTKYLHYIGKPVVDSSGKVTRRAGAIMDVTERIQAQIRMEEVLKDLQRSNKDLEQFAYIASHDLQEPIRMVKSYTELLEKRYSDKLDSNAIEFLGFIAESSMRMHQLVTDLLKYSRVTTKAQPFDSVDCNEILKEVLDDLRFKIQEDNAVIDYDKLPVVKADRTQLRQVFLNLVQNALKFKDNKTPEIKIKCDKRKRVWLFSIKDNGIGIEQKYQERIFEIFQRLHTREEYPGTGMGLAIVKKIVERHGGEIRVESELGKGSTFYFTLAS
jgi:signal transduction histidine kinase